MADITTFPGSDLFEGDIIQWNDTINTFATHHIQLGPFNDPILIVSLADTTPEIAAVDAYNGISYSPINIVDPTTLPHGTLLWDNRYTRSIDSAGVDRSPQLMQWKGNQDNILRIYNINRPILSVPFFLIFYHRSGASGDPDSPNWRLSIRWLNRPIKPLVDMVKSLYGIH